jgi:hypothetical protein
VREVSRGSLNRAKETYEMVPVAKSDDCVRIILVVESEVGIIRIYGDSSEMRQII